MNDSLHEDQNNSVIENYQEQEKMMILVYAQWCINNDLDPVKLYEKAYPDQLTNHTLEEIVSLTVPKNEADDIADDLVMQALQAFGNDDLAFIVQAEIDQKQSNK